MFDFKPDADFEEKYIKEKYGLKSAPVLSDADRNRLIEDNYERFKKVFGATGYAKKLGPDDAESVINDQIVLAARRFDPTKYAHPEGGTFGPQHIGTDDMRRIFYNYSKQSVTSALREELNKSKKGGMTSVAPALDLHKGTLETEEGMPKFATKQEAPRFHYPEDLNLKSDAGKAWLDHGYNYLALSTHQLAAMTNKMQSTQIRRLLVHHGIPLRNKSQAQANALRQEVRPHPTAGSERSPDVKDKIRKSMTVYHTSRQPKETESAMFDFQPELETALTFDFAQTDEPAKNAAYVAVVTHLSNFSADELPPEPITPPQAQVNLPINDVPENEEEVDVPEPTEPNAKAEAEPQINPMEASHDAASQHEALHGEAPEMLGGERLEDSLPQGDAQHKIAPGGELEEVEDEDEIENQKAVKEVSSTFGKTLALFPENAKAAIGKNHPGVHFFSDPTKLTAELAKISPEAAAKAKQGEVYYGAILPRTKQMLIAGTASPDQTADIQAYELSRASADGRDADEHWKTAVEKDHAADRLSAYANSPQRAWGMFGVLVNGKQVAPEELAKAFPAMTAVWQGYGLIPSGNKKPLVELTETFKPKAAVEDSPRAEADSAYSPKESALATFSRIGRQSLNWLKTNQELVGDWAKTVLTHVPPQVRMAAVGMLRTCYYHYYLANQMATNVAKARGMDEHKAKLLAKTLTAADAILGVTKVIPIAASAAATAASGSLLAGLGVSLGTSFIPVGSLAYIVLAGTKPGAVATFRSASKVVKAILAARNAKEQDKEFEKDDVTEILANHIAGLDIPDTTFWFGCFLAAMDETQGDVRLSCDIADEASQHGGGQSDFDDEEPPPVVPGTPQTPSEAQTPSSELESLLGAPGTSMVPVSSLKKDKGKKQSTALALPREKSSLGMYSNLHDALRYWGTEANHKGTPHQLRAHFAGEGYAGTGYKKNLEYEQEDYLDENGKKKSKPKLDEKGEKIPIPWKEIQGQGKEKTYQIPGSQSDHVGLEDFLKDKKSVTKREVKDFLDSRHTPLSEVDQNRMLAKLPEDAPPLDLTNLQAKRHEIAQRPDTELEPIERERPQRWYVADGNGYTDYFESEDQAEQVAQERNDEAYQKHERELEREFDLTEHEGTPEYKVDAYNAMKKIRELGKDPNAPKPHSINTEAMQDHLREKYQLKYTPIFDSVTFEPQGGPLYKVTLPEGVPVPPAWTDNGFLVYGDNEEEARSRALQEAAKADPAYKADSKALNGMKTTDHPYGWGGPAHVHPDLETAQKAVKDFRLPSQFPRPGMTLGEQQAEIPADEELLSKVQFNSHEPDYKSKAYWKDLLWKDIHDSLDEIHEKGEYGQSEQDVQTVVDESFSDIEDHLHRIYGPKLEALDKQIEDAKAAGDEDKADELDTEKDRLDDERNNLLDELKEDIVEHDEDFELKGWGISIEHLNIHQRRDFRSTFFDKEHEAQEAINDWISNYGKDTFDYPYSHGKAEDDDDDTEDITDPAEIRQHLLEQVDNEIAERRGEHLLRYSGKQDPNAGPKYDSYSMPGGQNYNEIHVTAPKALPKPPTVQEIMDQLDPEEVTDKDQTHWQLYNNAGRYGIEHIEDGAVLTPNGWTSTASNAVTKKWTDQHGSYGHVENPVVRERSSEYVDSDGKKNYFVQEWQGPSNQIQKDMPEALSARIYDIGIKRSLVKAVESGAGRMSWTTGDQQRERYNLRKKVDKIEWFPTADDPSKGQIKSYKNGRLLGSHSVGPHEEASSLEDAVGPELAEYLMKQETPTKEKHVVEPNPKVPGEWQIRDTNVNHILASFPNEEAAQRGVKGYRGTQLDKMTVPAVAEGKDLEMGGMGHRRLYDQMIPAKVRSILKKANAKVTGSKLKVINNPKKQIAAEKEGDEWALTTEYGGMHARTIKAGFPSEEAAVAYRDDPANREEMTHETVHTIDLTPEVKKLVEEGLAEFSEDTEAPLYVADFCMRLIDLDEHVDFAHEWSEESPVYLAKRKKAAATSGLALHITRQHNDDKTTKLAVSAATNANQGKHKDASMDHSLLFRMYREKKHKAAAYAHEIAMDLHSELSNPPKTDFEIDLDEDGGRVAPPFPTSPARAKSSA